MFLALVFIKELERKAFMDMALLLLFKHFSISISHEPPLVLRFLILKSFSVSATNASFSFQMKEYCFEEILQCYF